MTQDRVEFVHEKLGALDVSSNEVLLFDGIPGFPEMHRFALVEHDRGQEIAWLASLDDPALAFPVVDLRTLRSDVCDGLAQHELAAVEAKSSDCVELLGIVNMRHTPPRLNLEAPLLIHRDTRRGIQLIRERALEVPVARADCSDRVESPDVERPREDAS